MFKNPEFEALFDLTQAQMFIGAAARIFQNQADLELATELVGLSISIATVAQKIGSHD